MLKTFGTMEMKIIFLSNVCDVTEYLKNDYQRKFAKNIEEGDEASAVAIQSGMDCIEDAIRDYIARYAYPFKVRDLMGTFDMLLQVVSNMTEFEDAKLKKKIEDMGKGISEREEVEKEKEEQENIKEKLALLETKVDEQKQKINAIYFDEKKFSKIREDMEVAIESKNDVERVREINNRFSEEEIQELVVSIDEIFSSAWDDAIGRFEILTGEYKKQLEEICQGLEAISEELQNGEDYSFNGYSFANSLGVEKIKRLDVDSLRKQVETTKETITEGKYIKARNPIKDEEYNWWQFGKKLKRLLASDTIDKYIEEKKDIYNAEPLQKYLDDTLADFRELCKETARNYSDDIQRMKKQALKMASDIPEDIEATAKRIATFIEKINKYGSDINALEKEMEGIKEKKEFLQSLIDAIKVGGGDDV